MKDGVELCMNIMLTLPDDTYIFRNLITAAVMMDDDDDDDDGDDNNI